MKTEKDFSEARKERGSEKPKRYSKPTLNEYGKIEELTQSGGASTKDVGNLKQVGAGRS